MKSGIVATDAVVVSPAQSHGFTVVHRVEQLRDLAELLMKLAQHPASSEVLWAIRLQCERMQVDSWSHDAAEQDVLKAYFESVGGHASRWLQHMAHYENAVARATVAVEVLGSGCLRERTDDCEANLQTTLGDLRSRAAILRTANLELCASIEREATRMATRCRFCGSALVRRIASIRMLARTARTGEGRRL